MIFLYLCIAKTCRYADEKIFISREQAQFLVANNSILKEISSVTKAAVRMVGNLRDGGNQQQNANRNKENKKDVSTPTKTGTTTQDLSSAKTTPELNVENVQDNNKNQNNNVFFVSLRGAQPCVEQAKDALKVHMSYFDVNFEMNYLERELEDCRRELVRDMPL